MKAKKNKFIDVDMLNKSIEQYNKSSKAEKEALLNMVNENVAMQKGQLAYYEEMSDLQGLRLFSYEGIKTKVETGIKFLEMAKIPS